MGKKATEAQKTRRAKSWANGEQRKAALRQVQAAAEVQNRKTRQAGGLTPWEQACADRAARRGRG
jgi:hypothetical protein